MKRTAFFRLSGENDAICSESLAEQCYIAQRAVTPSGHMSKTKLFESVFSLFHQPAPQTDKAESHQINTLRDKTCQKQTYPHSDQKQAAQPFRRCAMVSSAHPLTPFFYFYAETEVSCKQKTQVNDLSFFLNLSILSHISNLF